MPLAPLQLQCMLDNTMSLMMGSVATVSSWLQVLLLHSCLTLRVKGLCLSHPLSLRLLAARGHHQAA
jgi:hypothetical protein